MILKSILLIALVCSQILGAQNTLNAQHYDTFSLHFDIGKYNFNTNETDSLKQFIAQKYTENQTRILVYGYADYLGTQSPNKTLSEQRANQTKQLLLQFGIKKEDIKLCTGIGQVNKKGEEEHGNSQYRKAEIYFSTKKTNAKLKNSQPAQKPTIDNTNLAQKIKNAEVDDVVNLKNLLFFNNSTVMRPISYPDLQQLLNVLKENPNLKIKIEGHICCNKESGMIKGTVDYNLSINRAKAVYFYLTDNGIDSKRLSFEGYGRTRPLYPNESTIEEELANRRVEIRILSK